MTRTLESLKKEKRLLLSSPNSSPLDWNLLANDFATLGDFRQAEFCLMMEKKRMKKADPDEREHEVEA